jgi:thioredoxin reductase (NADPH)
LPVVSRYATGCYDRFNPLGVPGEDSAKLTHFFREAHPYYDQNVAVIGAGNSAVEAALAVWRAGARVSLIHFLEGLDRGVKPWVLPDIENRIAERSISVYWHHRVEAIEPELIRVRNLDTDQTVELPNDRVLAMTGYQPDHTLLEDLGVEIGSDGAQRTIPGRSKRTSRACSSPGFSWRATLRGACSSRTGGSTVLLSSGALKPARVDGVTG